MLVESQCHNCQVTVCLFEVVLVSAGLILNCQNLLLDLVLIGLVRVPNCLEGIQALSFVGLKFILELLHALVKDLTFVREVLFLLFLAASELCLDLFEVCSYSVFVILTDEVYETVNLVQVCIQVVKSVFEV